RVPPAPRRSSGRDPRTPSAGRPRTRPDGTRSGSRNPARAGPRAWRGARRSGGSRPAARFRAGAALAWSFGLVLLWACSVPHAGARGAGLEAGFQARLDELVEVAVEHALGVGALDAGAEVLDARLVEHVVADLRAPADVGLAGLELLLLRV